VVAALGTQLWKPYQTYRLRREIARLGGNIYDTRPSGIEALFQPLMRSRAEVEVDVSLRGTDVSDAGLQHLKDFPKLSFLALFGTRVSNSGIQQLDRLTHLSGLSLGGGQMGDAALEHVKKLKGLTFLHLEGPNFTDAGMEQLTGLTNLEWLQLVETGVTEAAVNKLEKALPKLKVYFPP
jgi:hypothetical protein